MNNQNQQPEEVYPPRFSDVPPLEQQPPIVVPQQEQQQPIRMDFTSTTVPTMPQQEAPTSTYQLPPQQEMPQQPVTLAFESPSPVLPPMSTTERQYYWSHQPQQPVATTTTVIATTYDAKPSIFPRSNGAWIEPRGVHNTVHPILVTLCNFFIPGLGHLFIGQVNKALYYLLSYFLLSMVTGFLSCILIGLCLLPVMLIYWIIIMHDGYVMSDKLYNGVPIMQGECATGLATMGVSIFETTDVFVSGSSLAPAEWNERHYQITRSQA